MENIKYFYEDDATLKLPPMFQSKAFVFLLKWFVPPMYIFAWVVNMDSIKGTILFIFALAFGMIRAYYWVIRTRLINRSRELDIEMKELEVLERKQKSK